MEDLTTLNKFIHCKKSEGANDIMAIHGIRSQGNLYDYFAYSQFRPHHKPRTCLRAYYAGIN